MIPVNSNKLLRVKTNVVHNAKNHILNCEIVEESVTEHVVHTSQNSTCDPALPPHGLVPALCGPGDQTDDLPEKEDTKVSRGARKRNRLGPLSGATLTFSDRQRHRRTTLGVEWRTYEQRTIPDTISFRRRVHQYSASKRSAACRGIVSFERDEREEGFSTDIAQTKTTTNCI